MAQELGLSCQQVALGRIQPQPCPPDGGKYISQVKQGPVISMHQQVVEVHNAVAVGYICQHPLHQPLKSSWCIAEPKWHDTELPQPLPDGEGSLWSCVRGQLHLQVATAQPSLHFRWRRSPQSHHGGILTGGIAESRGCPNYTAINYVLLQLSQLREVGGGWCFLGYCCLVVGALILGPFPLPPTGLESHGLHAKADGCLHHINTGWSPGWRTLMLRLGGWGLKLGNFLNLLPVVGHPDVRLGDGGTLLARLRRGDHNLNPFSLTESLT